MVVVGTLCASAAFGERTAVVSPDGKNEIRLETEPTLAFQVFRNGRALTERSPMAMTVEGRAKMGGEGLKIVSKQAADRSGTVPSPIYKKASVDETAKGMVVSFGEWSVELIARNDGVAWRYVTDFGDKEVIVRNERIDLAFASGEQTVYATPNYGHGAGDPLQNSWEGIYTKHQVKDAPRDPKSAENGLWYAPLTFVYPSGETMVVEESDIWDYPGWNFNGTADGRTLTSLFAAYPKKTVYENWGADSRSDKPLRYQRVLEREDFLARTHGTRTYPWRVFALADNVAKIAESDIVFALASPNAIGDASWVKPGKVAWDWWNNWNLTGVDFRAGINTRTYEYYIDFAAKNGIEYVIFDEGWSQHLDVEKYNPDMDVPHLVRYANERGVGIILWAAWAQFHGRAERVVSKYAQMGVKGFKVDFMDRDDQLCFAFLRDFAALCAKYKMVVDYHGMSKPAGFARTYPNVLCFEGVQGLENLKGQAREFFPAMDCTIAFTRMAAGPLDYTPGAMRNFCKGTYHPHSFTPGSYGTRVHQMALMVVYEAPLEMLCDSPTQYLANRECFDYMRKLPVVWDETIALEGEMDACATIARRKGADWYVGSICGWQGHETEIDTSFLGSGEWTVDVFADGVNADRDAVDYAHRTMTVRAGEKIPVKLMLGGGWTAHFSRSTGGAESGNEIRSGVLWYDNRGHVINAHGGGVLFDEGIYWWYGEHKVYGQEGNRSHVGIHVYSSDDLVNWTDRGIALAVEQVENSDITDGCIMERPKVLRSKETGKFVMYFHLELKDRGYDAARTGIAVADRPEGPFRFVRSLRPTPGTWPTDVREIEKSQELMAASKELGNESGAPSERVKSRVPYLGHIEGGQMSRDMTLFADDDGKSYHIFASEYNSTLHIAELTDDLLGYTGRWFRMAEKDWTEAPAICKHDGWYFLIGSGCSGWKPNTARLYRSRKLEGPWENLGNPCRGNSEVTGVGSDLTWGGQSTFLLPVSGRPDLVIAMFDVWQPENHEESRYVWLPVTFTEGGMQIEWRSAWSFATRGDLADYVNPFVGTDGPGHTHPAAACPFGMIQAGPDTGTGKWEYCSGYQYRDKAVLGYSQTHLSGTGCPDLGDIQVLPFSEEVSGSPIRRPIDKASEKASPGYYSVCQPDDGVTVEIAATEHAAIYRFAWEKGRPRKVLLNIPFGLEEPWTHYHVTGSDVEVVGNSKVRGWVKKDGWLTDRTISFTLEFNHPWKKIDELPRTIDRYAKAPQYVAEFEPAADEALMMKVSLSLNRVEGPVADSVGAAERNLAAEIPGWDFETVRSASREKWNALFARSRCEGDDNQKRNWYTSLYHLYLQPNNWADAGEKPFYTTLSMWDTFRAAHPWYSIVNPEMVRPFLDSVMQVYRWMGTLPSLCYGARGGGGMIGRHSIPIFVDAYKKSRAGLLAGLEDMDWEDVYAAIRQTQTTRDPKQVKRDFEVYDKYGYYPCDLIRGESVSRTFETGYDDWCAAELASALGHDDDAAFFYGRSQNWKNVYDQTIGFARGKDSKGRWREPFDPFALGHGADTANDFTEGNAYHYTWHVLQDPKGLVDALGGAERMSARLDGLFAAPEKAEGEGLVVDVTGLIGQYVQGNEHSHHIIYFYPQVGHPEKAAERIREVFDKFYLPKPDGLCGNDDCGQMSAWYLFSAMGFYPFNPCGGEYIIGAPQVPKVVLEVGKRTPVRFVMTAKNLSKENKYVKSVTLNGKPIADWKIRHADIVNGGELVFEMGK